MTALEIVLISVLGALLIVATIYLFVFHTNKINRLQIFEEVNKDGIQGATVFFGDSLTDFFPVQDFFPNQTIYNRGIAGDKTSDLLKRIDNVIALKPHKVFLQIGTNDLGKNIKPRKIVDNIIKIHDQLKENVPHIEIYIISLYPVSHHRMWLSPIIAGLRSNKAIREVNFLLKMECTDRNIPYINLHEHLEDHKGRIKREYTLEGLHITGLGYSAIAEVLRPYVSED